MYFPPNLTAQLVKIAARNRLRSRNDHWEAHTAMCMNINIWQLCKVLPSIQLLLLLLLNEFRMWYVYYSIYLFYRLLELKKKYSPIIYIYICANAITSQYEISRQKRNGEKKSIYILIKSWKFSPKKVVWPINSLYRMAVRVYTQMT